MVWPTLGSRTAKEQNRTACAERPDERQFLPRNKSVFSFLRQLTTWHCPHLLLSAGRAAISCSPGPQQQTRSTHWRVASEWDTQRDGLLACDPTARFPSPSSHMVFDGPFPDKTSPCRATLHRWGLAQSASCDCGQRQTTNHIVDTCPLTKFEGGLNLYSTKRMMTQSYGCNLQRLQHSRRIIISSRTVHFCAVKRTTGGGGNAQLMARRKRVLVLCLTNSTSDLKCSSRSTIPANQLTVCLPPTQRVQKEPRTLS